MEDIDPSDVLSYRTLRARPPPQAGEPDFIRLSCGSPRLHVSFWHLFDQRSSMFAMALDFSLADATGPGPSRVEPHEHGAVASTRCPERRGALT
jgi:hypothetical protein